jgi:hypothetical protein
MRLCDVPAALVAQISDEAIGLFLEYRDRHGRDEPAARLAAVAEVIEGAAVDLDALAAELAAEGLPY